jgi:undecaprenyl-diphosphatase
MESVQAADEDILFWFEDHHRPWLTRVMKAMTFVGDPTMMVVLTILVAFGFLWWKRPRAACIVLATALLALLLSEVIKRTVRRPRPDVAWRLIQRPNQPSFPSGHSLNSMADYAVIALLTARHLRRRTARYLVIAAGLVLPLLIGMSRPYLGVHYPSDVLAGWTMGLACALLAYWTELRWSKRERSVVVVAHDVTGFQQPT